MMDSTQQARLAEHPEKTGRYGFIAQDLQKVFPELVISDGEYLAVNYDGMVPLLLEALKTVMQENAAMKTELAGIKESLQALQKSNQGKTGVESAPAGSSLLEQNQPNPFDQSTLIRYQTPRSAQQVGLVITNLSGLQLHHFEGLAAGGGQVEIPAGSLPSGTYVYTLVVDGQVVSSRRMILNQ